MAEDHGPSTKNDEQRLNAVKNAVKKCRGAGNSAWGQRGGQSPAYEEWTAKEPRERAAELDVEAVQR